MRYVIGLVVLGLVAIVGLNQAFGRPITVSFMAAAATATASATRTPLPSPTEIPPTATPQSAAANASHITNRNLQICYFTDFDSVNTQCLQGDTNISKVPLNQIEAVWKVTYSQDSSGTVAAYKMDVQQQDGAGNWAQVGDMTLAGSILYQNMTVNYVSLPLDQLFNSFSPPFIPTCGTTYRLETNDMINALADTSFTDNC